MDKKVEKAKDALVKEEKEIKVEDQAEKVIEQEKEQQDKKDKKEEDAHPQTHYETIPDKDVEIKSADSRGAAPLEFNYGPAGGPSYSIAFMGGNHYNATVPLHQARAEPRRSAR